MSTFVRLETGEYVAYIAMNKLAAGEGVRTPIFHVTPRCHHLRKTDPATVEIPTGSVQHLKTRACKSCAVGAFDDPLEVC